jgi:hypothetical protein
MISPNTAAIIMGLFTLIGIAGQTPLPAWIPSVAAMDIQSTCVWLALLGNGVGTYMHLTSSPAPGALTK